MGNFLNFVFVGIAAYVTGFIPGYLILGKFRLFDEEEIAAASFGATFILFYAMVFAAFALRVELSHLTAGAILALIAVAASSPAKTLRGLRGIWRNKGFRSFSAAYVLALCLIASIPVYTGALWGGDWVMHYIKSRLYLDYSEAFIRSLGSYEIAARTPLYNMVGSYYEFMFGESYWVFQVYSALANTLFIAGLHLFLKRLGLKRLYPTLFLMVLLIPFFPRNISYTWSKFLTLYFLLLSISFYLKFRKGERSTDVAIAGLFAGAAYLSHQYALIYIAAILLDMSVSLLGNRKRALLRVGALFIATLAVVISPWHGWLFQRYGARSSIAEMPVFSRRDRQHSFLSVRASNLLSNFLPVHLIDRADQIADKKNYAVSSLPDQKRWLRLLGIYDILLIVYFSTVPGALSATACSLILYLLIRRRDGPKFTVRGGASRTLLILIVTGILGGVAAQYFITIGGQASESMALALIAILVFAASGLESISASSRSRILAGLASEFLLVIVGFTALSRFLIGHNIIDGTTASNLGAKARFNTVFISDYIGGAFYATTALGLLIIIAIAARYWLQYGKQRPNRP